MSHQKKLDELLSRFPLSEDWQEPQLFQENFAIGKLQGEMVGLQCQNHDGVPVTGSSISFGENSATELAFYELTERMAMLDAVKTRPELFPESDEPEKWQYSKSNGIAIHKTWELACRAAKLELIERDVILKSWYGKVKPMFLEDVPSNFGLSDQYLVQSYCFSDSEVAVCGVFGFPFQIDKDPLVYGFAAGENVSTALEKAKREMLQRLCFLWGEEIPQAVPKMQTSPFYHQEFYLYPQSVQYIKSWLAGEFYEEAIVGSKLDSVQFDDITPIHLRGKLWVAKASHPDVWSLAFGDTKDAYLNELYEKRWHVAMPHPIA